MLIEGKSLIAETIAHTSLEIVNRCQIVGVLLL